MNREPAIIIALVQTAIALVVSFGFDLTVEQVGAIVAVSAAILGVVTRSKVTPTPTEGA